MKFQNLKGVADKEKKEPERKCKAFEIISLYFSIVYTDNSSTVTTKFYWIGNVIILFQNILEEAFNNGDVETTGPQKQNGKSAEDTTANYCSDYR